jgi:hypothetical protein
MQIWTLVNGMEAHWDLRLGQLIDETLPNFVKKKAPKKGREKETRGLYQSPGKQIAQKRWATRTTKNRTLLQSYEAYQLKKGEINLIKLQA